MPEIPDNIQREVTIRFVDTMDEVLDLALEQKLVPLQPLAPETEALEQAARATTEIDRTPLTN